MIVNIKPPTKQVNVSIANQNSSASTSIAGEESTVQISGTSIPTQAIDVIVTGQSGAITTSIAEGGSRRVAYMAKRLETPRKIAISGDVSGAEYFDGSRDIDIETRAILISNSDIEEMMANG